MHTRKCRYCAGTGQEVDPASIGTMLRQEREKMGVKLGKLAARIGVTAGFLCDLEKGRKNWTDQKIARYRQCLRELTSSF